MRVAGAPISWGVCEAPGWGHQLSPERVLGEMRELGLTATEFGPVGFLPPDPAALLRRYGLTPVGGFVPVVLHESPVDLTPVFAEFRAAGAEVVVLAAANGLGDFETRPDLDDAQWRTLLDNLDRIHGQAGDLTVVLHPHVGTVVERREDVERVLDGCGVPLCLDTGHLMAGGCDPAALVRDVPDRIAHVHLKDVRASVLARELSFTRAVRAGLFTPLGQGDADIAGIVRDLEESGYRGWYVLEQDTMLDAEPAPGDGPIQRVRTDIAFLEKT